MEMRKEDKHIKKSFQDILEEIGENQCSKYTREELGKTMVLPKLGNKKNRILHEHFHMWVVSHPSWMQFMLLDYY